MPRQNVQHDICSMDVVGQGFCAGGFDGLQAVGKNGSEDIDHLAVTAGLAFEFFAHTFYGKGQFPLLERRAVAQCARFAREHGQIMQWIIDRLAAPECAFMLADDLAILPTFQSICVGADLNRATDRAGIDGLTVIIEPDQTGLGYRC